MSAQNLDLTEVTNEIVGAESTLRVNDMRGLNLWRKLQISPELWHQEQYPGDEQFWVVATMGSHCLYFNHVEGGWGWGDFRQWGKISGYHWEQLEINHVVLQTLWAIDHG